MLTLNDGLILYHGSYCEVSSPDLKQCAKYKDFGQGFYLTSSKKQAKNFIKTSVKKAVLSGEIADNQNYGVISSFQYRVDKELCIRTYLEADAEWLHCVVGHRKKNTFPELIHALEKYDIIAGKIANDNTNATIAAYMALAYGEIGTESADAMCIGMLIPERLENQFCFRTDKALKSITFVESEQVWI